MAWIGAAIGAVGGLLSSSGKKGGGGSESSREPWAMAVPWLMQNLNQGQALQNEYTARPISARQRAALDNQYAQSDYARSLIPSLLGQMQGQPVGFDKKNPSARSRAWDWNALAEGALGQRSLSNVREAPAPAPARPGFSQQDMGYSDQQQWLLDNGRNPYMMGHTQGQPAVTGGYGSYRYGDSPQPGTQAYRDMMEFFLMGGNDPNGVAPGGMGIKRAQNPWLFGGGGTTTGDSVGGSPAADGSGGGGPGAAGGGVW